MKKFKKVLSVIAALSLVTSSVCSYAGAEETPLKSANWETTYTHVPNGPSNTGYSETKYLYCGKIGNMITVNSISNTHSNAEGYVYIQVTDADLKSQSAKLEYIGEKVVLSPKYSNGKVATAAHYKFSSYTSTSENRITVKGNINMYS